MIKKQQGFAAIETLLILVIIGIIGGIGWYALHTKHQTDRILNQADKISQNTPVKTASNAAASSAASQKELVVKEWGVKARYNSNLNLTYSAHTSQKPEYILLSSKELVSEGGLCATEGYGGSIDKYRSTDEYLQGDGGVDSGKTAAQFAATLDKSTYGHVGDYYYFYTSPQAACGDDQKSMDLQGQTNTLVKSLLHSLVPSS